MSRVSSAFSWLMLVLGGVLILAGLILGLSRCLDRPPEPVVGDAGAVVLAVTAAMPKPMAPQAPTIASSPSPAATHVERALPQGPTPDLLPDWTPAPKQPPQRPTATARSEALPSPPPTLTPAPQANGPPTRILAPAIRLDAEVVPMGWQPVERRGTLFSEWVVPKNAAGWHRNSGLPGQGENVVLSGHHNIEGKVFRYVVDLQPGDTITLYVGRTSYLYLVSEKYILKEAGMPLKVRQKNAQWIMPTGDERLTLVTCWPYEWPGNTHRVIVVARPATTFDAPDPSQ